MRDYNLGWMTQIRSGYLPRKRANDGQEMKLFFSVSLAGAHKSTNILINISAPVVPKSVPHWPLNPQPGRSSGPVALSLYHSTYQ